MTTQSAERKRVRYYKYGDHVVQVVREIEENGDVKETLSLTRFGYRAAKRRGGHIYARLPRRWRAQIREEEKKYREQR